MLKARVARELAKQGEPDCTPAERDCDKLREEFRGPREYGYDAVSCWLRSSERAVSLVREYGRPVGESPKILDVGCGDGMLAPVMSLAGAEVSLTDLTDWRSERARAYDFAAVDLNVDALPYDNDLFDIVCSYNTFEHLPRPDFTFGEMLRVCKPGGLVRICFDPLYASPWGLHAYRTLSVPYAQWLFTEEFLNALLDKLGISDLGEDRDELQPLNRWRVAEFMGLMENPAVDAYSYRKDEKLEYLQLALRYPGSFRGRTLSVRDLITSGLRLSVFKANTG